MWPELIEDVLLELKLLRGLLAQCEPLRDVVADATASETEKLAAASLLQSFSTCWPSGSTTTAPPARTATRRSWRRWPVPRMRARR